jgi:hypothetical protein
VGQARPVRKVLGILEVCTAQEEVLTVVVLVATIVPLDPPAVLLPPTA